MTDGDDGICSLIAVGGCDRLKVGEVRGNTVHMLVLLYIVGLGIPMWIAGHMIYVVFVGKRRSFSALAIADDEAVILRVHGASVEDRYKTRVEFENFVDRLQWAMGNIGEVRDVSLDDGAATITILGENAEEMYAKIQTVVRHTSFSKNASVVLRYGPAGSRERRTHMAN